MSVLYVASNQPRAGKTAVSVTLARKLSQDGKQVALFKPVDIRGSAAGPRRAGAQAGRQLSRRCSRRMARKRVPGAALAGSDAGPGSGDVPAGRQRGRRHDSGGPVRGCGTRPAPTHRRWRRGLTLRSSQCWDTRPAPLRTRLKGQRFSLGTDWRA